MKLRTASRLAVIALVVIVGAVLYVTRATWAAPRGASLAGMALGGTSAPTFQLSDQHGAAISLSRLRGEPAILTFMSTRCDATCDQAAANMRAALSQLGAAGSRVAVLVVSEDPSGDTPASVAALSQRLRMASRWHYLSGPCSALVQVWAAYGAAGAGCAPSDASTGMTRSSGLYVLDARGREQVFLDSAFTVSALAANLRALSTP
jgi:protein SCO1/2